MAPMIEANVSRMGVVYYNALKMKDPHNVLLGANYAGSRGRGPVWRAYSVSDQAQYCCDLAPAPLAGLGLGLG